jgi:hypothetical protein
MMTASILTPKCLSRYYRVAVYDHLAALVVRSRPQLDDPFADRPRKVRITGCSGKTAVFSHLVAMVHVPGADARLLSRLRRKRALGPPPGADRR